MILASPYLYIDLQRCAFPPLANNIGTFPLSLCVGCLATTRAVDSSMAMEGGGVTKVPYLNTSVSNISAYAKLPVNSVQACSYLTDDAAAMLRQHMSNNNVISNK